MSRCNEVIQNRLLDSFQERDAANHRSRCGGPLKLTFAANPERGSALEFLAVFVLSRRGNGRKACRPINDDANSVLLLSVSLAALAVNMCEFVQCRRVNGQMAGGQHSGTWDSRASDAWVPLISSYITVVSAGPDRLHNQSAVLTELLIAAFLSIFFRAPARPCSVCSRQL